MGPAQLSAASTLPVSEEKVSVPQGLRPASFCLLAIVFLAVYIGSVFSPPLLDDADSTHAEAAREMFVTGDYVTLHVNGVRYLEKAPLPYWLVAESYRLFGINEFSTRLPMALSILLLGILAFVWGRRAFGDRAGIYAALFVYTAAGVFLFTRILIPDVLLSFLIAAALYFFLTGLETKKSWRWYAAYTCMALGVLTKGLIALAFPGGAAFIYLVITGEWRRWREFRLPSGLALFFAIAAPWHILAGLRNSGGQGGHGFFWFYFVNEHFLRFLGKRYPRDYNKLPWALYWSLHLVWLFPWSLYLPAAIRTVVDVRKNDRKADFSDRTRLLCWILAGLILLFFAISTNQEYYTFPAYLPAIDTRRRRHGAIRRRGLPSWNSQGSAEILCGAAGGYRNHSRSRFDDSVMAVTPFAVRAGYRKRAREAQHGNGHSVHFAHARSQLRIVCGASIAGVPCGRGSSDSTGFVVSVASSPTSLRCDLDNGLGDGRVSRSSPHCAGPIRTIPFVQGTGTADCRTSA